MDEPVTPGDEGGLPRSRPACAMAPMVEADRDGRLDARDQASLARHLALCAECRALSRELDRLEGLVARPILPSATPLEHQRRRVALLNEVVRRAESTDARRSRWGETPHAPRPSRRDGHAHTSGAVGQFPSIVAGWKVRAGLALAAAIGVGGAVLMVQHAGKVEHVAMARKLPAPPKLPAALVHGGTGARFTWGKLGGIERIDLEEGEIDLTVRHLGSDERVIVSTGNAEVEVRGTVFHVEAHARHVVRVAVTEGRVEVRYAGEQVFLDAGQAWSPGGGDGLAHADAAAGSERAGARSGDADGAEGRLAGARVLSAAGVGTKARHDGGSASALPPKDPRGAAKGSDAAASRSGNAGADEGVAKGFVEGMALVARGDYAAGASMLEQYRAAHGDDARAEDAAYMAALALQRAGRREDAAAAARRYLSVYPNGRRRAEMAAIAR